jgi:hypothetical protein
MIFREAGTEAGIVLRIKLMCCQISNFGFGCGSPPLQVVNCPSSIPKSCMVPRSTRINADRNICFA